MTASQLTPTLVQQLARLAGLDLTPEQATDLTPALMPLLVADAQIAQLELGTLSAVGCTWQPAAHD